MARHSRSIDAEVGIGQWAAGGTHSSCRLPTADCRQARGFTLLESMLAAVVLAVVVIGLCGMIAAAHQSATAGEAQSAAGMLARQLMEQIAGRPFDELSGYHGFSDTSNELVMADGTSAGLGVGPFQREVAVEYRLSPSGPAAPAGNFAVVRVTVTAPNGQRATLRQLFCNVELRR